MHDSVMAWFIDFLCLLQIIKYACLRWLLSHANSMITDLLLELLKVYS